MTLRGRGTVLREWRQAISVAEPLVAAVGLPGEVDEKSLSVTVECVGVESAGGMRRLRYARPLHLRQRASQHRRRRSRAAMNCIDGGASEQYRHATRRPELYWMEALRRDAGDSRSNTALGRWRLKRGEFAEAETHLRAAIARLTRRNPNPYDGEAHYQLGLCLRYQRRFDEAYAAFYKSTWNAAWRAPAYLALAELDARADRWDEALDHAERCLRVDRDNLNAQAVRAITLRRSGAELRRRRSWQRRYGLIRCAFGHGICFRENCRTADRTGWILRLITRGVGGWARRLRCLELRRALRRTMGLRRCDAMPAQ